LIPLLAGLVALSVVSLRWKESLKIQRVIVEGTRIISADEVFTLANVKPKSSMLDLDIYNLQQRLLKQPFIKSVNINRQYPAALRIRVTEREPIATMNVGQIHYVDNDGKILPHVESEVKFDLPVISGIDLTPNSRIGNMELMQAINILKMAESIDSSLYDMISEINMNDGKDIILYSGDTGAPILLGRGDIEKKLLTLQSFWNRFVNTDDVEQLQYVDLRFDEQVVAKWNRQGEKQSTKILM